MEVSFSFSALSLQDCASSANRLIRAIASKVQICFAVRINNIPAKLCPTRIHRSEIMQANVARLAHRQPVTSGFSREQTAELFRVARCGIQHKFGWRVTSAQHRSYQECSAEDDSKVQSVHDRKPHNQPNSYQCESFLRYTTVTDFGCSYQARQSRHQHNSAASIPGGEGVSLRWYRRACYELRTTSRDSLIRHVTRHVAKARVSFTRNPCVYWCPRWDSNPCYRRERAVSWAGLDDGDARRMTAPAARSPSPTLTI